jgi:prophage regulatory protein
MMDDTIDQNKNNGFLRLPQVLKLIPVSKSTWWNGCKTGQFPKPYKLAPRVTAWKVGEVQDCLQNFQNNL